MLAVFHKLETQSKVARKLKNAIPLLGRAEVSARVYMCVV